jgi:hypothetical protein
MIHFQLSGVDALDDRLPCPGIRGFTLASAGSAKEFLYYQGGREETRQ